VLFASTMTWLSSWKPLMLIFAMLSSPKNHCH
jgi:hypothetical protein